jgi:hypothetical protein
VGDRDQLVIPYTLEANDMRFATAAGLHHRASSSAST